MTLELATTSAKMLRHSDKKPAFLTVNRCHSHTSVKENLTTSFCPFKVVPLSFEHGLASLIRGGGGFTSTRSWAGHLSQNRVVSQALLQLVVA